MDRDTDVRESDGDDAETPDEEQPTTRPIPTRAEKPIPIPSYSPES